MKSMWFMLLIIIASFLIAGLWNQYPVIKNAVHSALDPTAGSVLNYNIYLGMFIVVAAITLLTTLVQKYTTDQEALRKMKTEQKSAQEEMKKFKNDPAKMLEFNKKQMENMPKMFEATMKPLAYTFVPIVLFFRWFNDYFTSTALAGFKFFGFLSWFWFYLIFAIVFSSVFRKVLKAA